LPRRPFLLLLFRHKEEGDDNLLPLPFLFQQHHRRRRQRIDIIFFFFNTKRKATITSCHCLFRLNTTKEKGDGNKLPSPFSLQHHHIKR